MKLLGYSERGLINSFFYEMYYNKKNNPILLVENFLNKITFPHPASTKPKPDFSPVKEATIFIEQSFSDFGDSDIVILVDNGQKHVIFMEAKVCGTLKTWLIKNEFNSFTRSINQFSLAPIEKNRVEPSNLFTQLYFKQKLIELIQNNKSLVTLNNATREFPSCFSKIKNKELDKESKRSIGNNKVVLEAVGRIRNYCNMDNTFFVSLVPDCETNLDVFYRKTLAKPQNPLSNNHPWNWDVKNWGYISWEKIEDFCESNTLVNTLKLFDFNKGQIYKSNEYVKIIDELLSLMKLRKGELPKIKVDTTSAPSENIFQLKALKFIPSINKAPEELKKLYDFPGEYRINENINILDLLGVYKSGENKVILYDLLIKLCSIQLNIDYEGLKTVVLYHELAHSLTHRGLDKNKRIWRYFDMATSEDKEYFAQIYTYKLLEKQGRMDLIDIMDRLADIQSHIYQTYRNSKNKSIKNINIDLQEKRLSILEVVKLQIKPLHKVNRQITVRFIISQYDSWLGTKEISLLMEYSSDGNILYKKEEQQLRIMKLVPDPIDKTNMNKLPDNLKIRAMDLNSLLIQPNIEIKLAQSSSNKNWAHPTDYIIDLLEDNAHILHWKKSFGLYGDLNDYNGIFKDILAVVLDIIEVCP